MVKLVAKELNASRQRIDAAYFHHFCVSVNELQDGEREKLKHVL